MSNFQLNAWDRTLSVVTKLSVGNTDPAVRRFEVGPSSRESGQRGREVSRDGAECKGFRHRAKSMDHGAGSKGTGQSEEGMDARFWRLDSDIWLLTSAALTLSALCSVPYASPPSNASTCPAHARTASARSCRI